LNNDVEFHSEKRRKFIESSLANGTKSGEPRTKQNEFAYALSLSMEATGSAMLAGILPIHFVMHDSAFNNIKSWILCRALVQKIRERNQLQHKRIPENILKTGHARFHAEWLAYASAIYLEKYWAAPQLDELIAILCEKEGGTIDEIKRREKILRRANSNSIPRKTFNQLNRLFW